MTQLTEFVGNCSAGYMPNRVLFFNRDECIKVAYFDIFAVMNIVSCAVDWERVRVKHINRVAIYSIYFNLLFMAFWMNMLITKEFDMICSLLLYLIIVVQMSLLDAVVRLFFRVIERYLEKNLFKALHDNYGKITVVFYSMAIVLPWPTYLHFCFNQETISDRNHILKWFFICQSLTPILGAVFLFYVYLNCEKIFNKMVHQSCLDTEKDAIFQKVKARFSQAFLATSLGMLVYFFFNLYLAIRSRDESGMRGNEYIFLFLFTMFSNNWVNTVVLIKKKQLTSTLKRSANSVAPASSVNKPFPNSSTSSTSSHQSAN